MLPPKATAGLRSLPFYQAETILEAVRREFARPTTGFAFRPEWARMISGQQEGLNGWIATNYLAGVFNEPLTETERKSTYGLVEMVCRCYLWQREMLLC